MNNKRRIAICLSGVWRHWDLAKHTLFQIEKHFPDCEFDYFISVWDKSMYDGIFQWNAEVTAEHILPDFENRNLVDYEILPVQSHDCNQVHEHENPMGKITDNSIHSWALSYLRYKVGMLKTKHEVAKDFVYDYVLAVRPDYLYTEYLFESLEFFITKDHGGALNEPSPFETPYSGAIFNAFVDGDHDWDVSTHYGFSVGDNLCFSTSQTHDMVANLYNYCYVEQDMDNPSPVYTHVNEGKYFRYCGIYATTPSSSPLFVRSTMREFKDKFSDWKWVNQNKRFLEHLKWAFEAHDSKTYTQAVEEGLLAGWYYDEENDGFFE